MTIYRLSDGGVAEQRGRMLRLLVPIGLAALAAVFWLVRADIGLDAGFLLPAGLVVSMLGWRITREVQRQEAVWRSIEVELGDDYLARRQLRTQEVRLARGEISGWRESGAGLLVQTADKYRWLLAPRGLEQGGDDAIRARLAAWVPAPAPAPAAALDTAKASGVLALMLAGAAALFLFTNPWLAGAGGAVLLAVMAWSAVQISRTAGIDARTRRSMAVGALLLAYLVLMRLAAVTGALEWLIRALAGGQGAG